MTRKPVLIEIEDQDAQSVDVVTAALVPDLGVDNSDQNSKPVLRQTTSRLGRWFWSLLGIVLTTVIGIAAWDFASGLLQRWPVLGMIVSAVLAVLVLLAGVMALGELASLSRMRRVEGLRNSVTDARADMRLARSVSNSVADLYRGRRDLDWARARLDDRRPEVMDPDAVLSLTEDELLAPLDAAAQREVERAARQVATVTAVVPIALADVLAVLVSSLRMIRAIAVIYGGRSGFWSSWKLTRAVMTHLAATGAVAIGDDMLEPILGGSVLTKLSRRFGEGLVNGALTARVGIAAMELCRPMPFSPHHKPSVRGVIRRALTGLFSRSDP